MNIEPKHKDEKTHNDMKHWRNEDPFHCALSRAGLKSWQEQCHAQQELDAAQNGEDIHMASVLSKFRLNHNS